MIVFVIKKNIYVYVCQSVFKYLFICWGKSQHLKWNTRKQQIMSTNCCNKNGKRKPQVV